MEDKESSKRQFSRRKFLGSTATLAAFSVVPLSLSSKSFQGEKKAAVSASGSNFGGVQIGAITYSWRSMPGGVDNVIKYCKEAGISSVELMSNDVEDFLGAPKNPKLSLIHISEPTRLGMI